MTAGLLLTFALVALPYGVDQDSAGQGRAAQMRFRGMDANNDGVITRDEWRGSARSFQRHDWNGDGRLAGNEVRFGAWQDSNIEEADHDPTWAERYMSWTDRGFASLDHNRDRRITPNEWHYDRETFRRADRNRDDALDRTEFLGADMDDDRGDSFDDLDVDGDGRVERNEWHGSDDAFTWLDRNRDGRLSRLEVTGEERVTSPRDQFASLDVDGNGTIARDEWHWSLGSFSQRDLNRDGVLSRREFATTAGSTTAGAVPLPTTVRVDPTATLDGHRHRHAGRRRAHVRLERVNPDEPRLQRPATPAGSRTGRRAPASPIDAVAGVLIARIGDSNVVVVGDQTTLTAPRAGVYISASTTITCPTTAGNFK